MSSYICGDQTTMAAAEGIARCEGYSADSVQLLSTLLRMANETATGTRATGETVHQPVDQAKRRAYDDLEMIGSCECLAYQLDTAGRCGGICRRLRAAAGNLMFPDLHRTPPAMTEHGHGVQRSGAPVRRAS